MPGSTVSWQRGSAHRHGLDRIRTIAWLAASHAGVMAETVAAA